jgi:hypothetical protein
MDKKTFSKLLFLGLSVFSCALSYADITDTYAPVEVTVPFDYVSITRSQTIYIRYDSNGIYRGVNCGYYMEPYTAYIATWRFGDEDMISRGPNEGHNLMLYFSGPNANADPKGKITVTNQEKFAFTLTCKFIS